MTSHQSSRADKLKAHVSCRVGIFIVIFYIINTIIFYMFINDFEGQEEIEDH